VRERSDELFDGLHERDKGLSSLLIAVPGENQRGESHRFPEGLLAQPCLANTRLAANQEQAAFAQSQALQAAVELLHLLVSPYERPGGGRSRLEQLGFAVQELESDAHLPKRREPLVNLLRQQSSHQKLQRVRKPVWNIGRLAKNGDGGLRCAFPLERVRSGQDFTQKDAEGEDIRSLVHGFSTKLFGRHVRGSSDGDSASGKLLVARRHLAIHRSLA